MVQTVLKTVKFPLAFLGLSSMPVVVQRQVPDGPDSAENREVSTRILGLSSMPVVVQRQVPDGRDSAENCGVSAVGAALGQGC